MRASKQLRAVALKVAEVEDMLESLRAARMTQKSQRPTTAAIGGCLRKS